MVLERRRLELGELENDVGVNRLSSRDCCAASSQQMS